LNGFIGVEFENFVHFKKGIEYPFLYLNPMKKAILFLLISVGCNAQQIITKDSAEINYLIRNCNIDSKNRAQGLLVKYQKEQTDNMFEITLKTYFEILQYSNCLEYDEFLERLWTENKVISENYFNKKFLNKKENYSKFIKGFNSPQDFRFATNHPDEFSLGQGINNSLWFEMLFYIKSVSNDDYKLSVQKNIEQLTGHELLNFLKVIQLNFSLDEFENSLVNKMEKVNYPFDLDFLMRILIQNKNNHSRIEQILNNRKEIWDTGNWSIKYWHFIHENNFKIETSSYFRINENGLKVYDINKFINYYESKGEIGSFPLIKINHSLNLSYSKEYSTLKDFLQTLNIQNIVVKKSEDAIKLYGNRGKDGFLDIMTY
jgi:hypothetical protein